MKRFGLFLFVLLVMASLGFAATTSSGTVGSVSGQVKGTAELTFGLDLSSIDSFEIGFSKTIVDEFSDSASSADAAGTDGNKYYPLTVAPGSFVANNDDNSLYVYWKIHSPNPCKISLSASPLKKETNTIHIIVSNDFESTGYGDTGSTRLSATTTASDIATLENIFVFDKGTFTGQQAVGSHQIKIETTDKFDDKPAGVYTGTLTLTITAG